METHVGLGSRRRLVEFPGQRVLQRRGQSFPLLIGERLV